MFKYACDDGILFRNKISPIYNIVFFILGRNYSAYTRLNILIGFCIALFSLLTNKNTMKLFALQKLKLSTSITFHEVI